MSLKSAFIALFCGLFLTGQARAEILFEAFYRIEKNRSHTGYMIQRLSTDKAGNRVLSSYIRSKYNGGEVYVTSKSTAKPGKAAPVETVHTSNAGGVPFSIISRFKNGKGVITYHSNNSRKANLTETAQTAPYPSAFMFFMTDFAKFQPGKKYAYSAFFEENGRTQIGKLSLLGAKEGAGKRVFQILNDDSGQPVENFVAENGEPLGSRSVSTGSTAYWVATKEEAVGDMTYPTGEMTKLFGDLPQGKKNVWSKAAGFESIKVIDAFTLWNGARAVSSSAAGEVLPLPMRSLK
jgi:hypothetical protein